MVINFFFAMIKRCMKNIKLLDEEEPKALIAWSFIIS